MNGSTPSHDPDRRAAARSWYATAATAGAVAALALIAGFGSTAIRIAGVLLAAAAVIAVAEGHRRRRTEPSRLGVAAVAVLTAAAALLCLFGLATGGLLR